jgi:hypothetical protein
MKMLLGSAIEGVLPKQKTLQKDLFVLKKNRVVFLVMML